MNRVLYCFFIALLFLPLKLRADVNYYPNKGGCCKIAIEKSIKSGDYEKLVGLFNLDSLDWNFDSYTIYLNSPGGDVEAALKIGNFLRKNKIHAIVDDESICASSCVFIFAGAVVRIVENGKIGIHRPFIMSTADVSTEQREKNMRLRENLILSYLNEMHISRSLYDAMMVIPSDEVHFLNKNELKAYGLIEIDPVYQEAEDAKMARFLGISMEELMQRKARKDNLCPEPDYKSAVTDEMMQHWAQCGYDVLHGLR